MVRRGYYVCLCILMMTLLTGCWDNVPIEERGFVIGSALDMKDEKINGNYELTLTNQFVVPAGASTTTGGGGEEQEAFANLSASGNSVFAMDEEMASLTSKIPFFEHLKLLVISEELLSTPHLFADTLDMFVRDKEMRRGVKVVVTEEAKALFDFKPENAKLPAVYINDMLEDSLEKTSLFKPVLVGDIHEFLLTNRSFTIPKMTSKGDKVQYEGAAVFHGFKDKMVGSLDRDEMIGLNLIMGGMHGGTLEFDFEGDLITFRIYNAKAVVKINPKDPENIKIDIDIGLEGGVAEVFGNKSLDNPENIKGIEKAAAKEVEKIINRTVEKAQKELNADIFGFGDKLRQRHYKTWQKIKDDWDHGENYFAKSDVHVKAKAKIRTAGASNKTESKRKE